MSNNDCCCNNNCYSPTNDGFDLGWFWVILIIFIFRGVPVGNDCFWNGYCNAFNSSAFSCHNFNNSVFNTNSAISYNKNGISFNNNGSLFN